MVTSGITPNGECCYDPQGRRYDAPGSANGEYGSPAAAKHAHVPIERERFSFRHTIAPWMDGQRF